MKRAVDRSTNCLRKRQANVRVKFFNDGTTKARVLCLEWIIWEKLIGGCIDYYMECLMYGLFDYVNVKEGLRWRQLMIDARLASGAIVVFDEQRWGVLMHSDELNKDMN